MRVRQWLAGIVVASGLASVPAPAAAQSPYNLAMWTYVYDGCIPGLSCHRLTWTVYQIPLQPTSAPIQQIIPTNRTVSFTLEHQINGFGWSVAPLAPATPRPGIAELWAGWELGTICTTAQTACTGTVIENGFTDNGPIHAARDWAPASSYQLTFNFVDANGAPLGSGTTTLTQTSAILVTPEPGTYALMAAGLAAIAVLQRRRRV